MNNLNAILVLCLAVAAYGFQGHIDSRIVGGKDVEVNQFPYQVSLRLNGKHFCGGSIVDDRYIVTASHCFEGNFSVEKKFKNMTIHAGTIRLDQPGDVYAPEIIVTHKYFVGKGKFVNDVSLVRVNKKIMFTKSVNPIRLASNSDTYEGSAGIATGWGLTSYPSGTRPEKLQWIMLTILSQTECKQDRKYLLDSQMCTDTKKGGGICFGDSGGPLVVNGLQVGIVASGKPCATGISDVFTRVSSFFNWIKKHQSYMNHDIQERPADGDYYIL